MDSKLEINNSSLFNKPSTDQNEQQLLEHTLSSSSFSDIVKRLVMGRPPIKPIEADNSSGIDSSSSSSINISSGGGPNLYPTNMDLDKRQNKTNTTLQEASQTTEQASQVPPTYQQATKRSCRAPLSRKFAHPCSCGGSNNQHKFFPTATFTFNSNSNINNNHHSSTNLNSSGSSLPSAALSPLHLYDPISKKCLPTSRNRDMLLKDCHYHSISSTAFVNKLHHGNSGPCVYDDLVCDARRFRCVCKPNLHLYYESNSSTFGCVPIGATSSPDGRINCRSGHFYNVISKECQKIFDVNELPPNYTTGVSATQFSFVTIVLIWILLLILIVTAKLRKLRTSNLYRNSPSSERRLHHGNTYRHPRDTSAWLHPFIAAVNGHHHLNQHRTTVERHTQVMGNDDSGNYNDTDLFLSTGNRRINDMLSDNNFAGSQQSLNNPPPKFEEIYPSCPGFIEEAEEQQGSFRPPSNDDLPTYDEAMKLQNTMPPDPKE